MNRSNKPVGDIGATGYTGNYTRHEVFGPLGNVFLSGPHQWGEGEYYALLLPALHKFFCWLTRDSLDRILTSPSIDIGLAIALEEFGLSPTDSLLLSLDADG